jgi:hypothetical protein
MTRADAQARGTLLERLRAALRDAAHPNADAVLQPLPDKGLAHDHVRIVGTGVLARLPKQSQLGLAAQDNLDYQAACFERASASGHAPRLAGRIAPSAWLPRGGLLVQEIVGQPARLPHDLPAIVDALAAIHALPLPPSEQRAPLLDPPDALAALAAENDAQAAHFDAARLDAACRARIERVAFDWRALVARAARPSRRLISFDAHPGNFLIEADGRAMLVDLEKARYGHPPLDLAHATLYTSTTWDVESCAELSTDEVGGAYERWLGRSADAAQWRRWLVPLRAAMWLWSVSWCAKWRVLSARAAATHADGEDWSAARSDAALVRHVRDRVDCYLSPPVVDRVVDEFETLARRFGS